MVVDDKYSLTYEIAKMYYEQGKTQQQIADQLNVSRPQVQRLLNEAEHLGIYRPLVVPPMDYGYGYLRRLEDDFIERVEEKFGYRLKDVILVPGRAELLDSSAENEIENNEGSLSDVREAIVVSLARTAAEYLDGTLKGKEVTKRDVLCVPWGYLSRLIANQLKPTRNLPYLRVVPMLGVLGVQRDQYEANVIAQDIAAAYHCRECYTLPAPAIVRNPNQKEVIRDLPLVGDVLKVMDDATFVMTGLKHVSTNAADCRLIRKHLLAQEEVEAIKKVAVGEIAAWWFDTDGNPVSVRDKDTNETIIPIGLGELQGICGIEHLKNMVRDQKTVAVVAGADRRRLEPIKAALRGRLMNVLITDDATAQELLGSISG